MSFASSGPGRPSRTLTCWCLLGWLGLSAAALVALEGPADAAAPRAASGRTQSKAKKKRPAKGAKSASSMWLFSKPANVVPNQQGKIVVFPFRNDDGDALSTQIGQLLEARGLELVPGVRPVDTVEQFRDVATHLGLVAYIDGDIRGTDAKTKVTVRLRSGFTGRQVSQAVFSEPRADLAREISDKLWTRLAPSMAHACADASKPRKASRNTLQINAGTPIETASQ
jgi:hypothetical protein